MYYNPAYINQAQEGPKHVRLLGLSHDILTQPLNALKLIATREGKSLISLTCTWSVPDQGSTFPGRGSISNLRPLSGT